MQAVVERGVGQIGDAAQIRPAGGLPQRHAAGTARQRKAQKNFRIRNAAPAQKRRPAIIRNSRGYLFRAEKS